MSRAAVELKPFTLEHFQGWARTLILDSGDPWELDDYQILFVQDLFDGFKLVMLIVPEGNGKTTLVSGLSLYHIQHRRSGFVPLAAASREQTEWIYRQAEGFVFRSEEEGTLPRGLFTCLEGYRRIRCDPMGSRIQVFAAEARTSDGIIPTQPTLDELHNHKDLALYRRWLGKLGKRDAQLVAISTAGEVGSEFEEERERLRREATDRQEEETFLRAVGMRGETKQYALHDWSVPESGDIDDLELVARANPSRRITVETLAAKRELMPHVPHWSRFTCNRPTRSTFAAIAEREWFAAQVSLLEWPEGVPITAGLDVAWTRDTTALVGLWIRDREFRLFGPATILEPPGDGTMLDPRMIERAIVELHQRNPIATLVMDTSSAMETAAWVESELGIPVVDRQQTNPLAALDYERFTEALRQGWLHHVGDEGLTDHVLNAIATILPLGDLRFDRPHRSRASTDAQRRRVIDALAAAAMAHTFAVADFYDPSPPNRTFTF